MKRMSTVVTLAAMAMFVSTVCAGLAEAGPSQETILVEGDTHHLGDETMEGYPQFDGHPCEGATWTSAPFNLSLFPSGSAELTIETINWENSLIYVNEHSVGPTPKYTDGDWHTDTFAIESSWLTTINNTIRIDCDYDAINNNYDDLLFRNLSVEYEGTTPEPAALGLLGLGLLALRRRRS